MPYKIFIIFTIIALGFGYGLWDLTRTPGNVIKTNTQTLHTDTRTPAPDAILHALDGTQYRLHDFENKVIILNFWATWCAPCIIEFPELLELAAIRNEDIIFIAVSVDDRIENIERFIAKMGNKAKNDNVFIIHDHNKVVAQDIFQSLKYPETYIIDRELIIRRKIAGIIEWTGEETLRFIDDLIKK